MIVAESPDYYKLPTYEIASANVIENLVNGDWNEPARERAILMDGWPYMIEETAPLDLLWAGGGA